MKKIFLVLFGLILAPPCAFASSTSEEDSAIPRAASFTENEEGNYNSVLALPHKALRPFYFMRHGKTDWNEKNLYMGCTNIPINPEGKQQAVKAANLLENEGIEYVVTGPLLRAVDTAKIIAEILNAKLILMDEFRQCRWGSMEGKPLDGGEMIRNWLLGITPSGAETVKEFDSRIFRGIREVFKLPGRVLIVSHGGVYRAMQRLMGLPITSIDHCSPIFHYPPNEQGDNWKLATVGCSSSDVEESGKGSRKKQREARYISSENSTEAGL